MISAILKKEIYSLPKGASSGSTLKKPDFLLPTLNQVNTSARFELTCETRLPAGHSQVNPDAAPFTLSESKAVLDQEPIVRFEFLKRGVL